MPQASSILTALVLLAWIGIVIAIVGPALAEALREHRKRSR